MQFRVLGPIQVVEDGNTLAVAAGHQRALLALLLLHVNRVVTTDRILDELWGDDPPETGAKTVAFHVSRLRDALRPSRAPGETDGVVATAPGGYMLRAVPDQIDACRFERLALEGRQLLRDDPETARTRFADALGMWHGEPYAELADAAFLQPEIRRLEELRLQVTEDRFGADLALGRHADVIDELTVLVDEHPLREHARGQLMVAQYRAGRQAEALRTYAAGRQLLAEELGIDPGPELQQIEGQVLRQDPRLDPPARHHVVRNPYKGLRPFEERDSADFFGREALVARLVARLAEAQRRGRLLAVVGPSGSGKSSAVRAGLLPALRRGEIPGSERWAFGVMQPGTRPFRELAAALRVAMPDNVDGLEARLRQAGGLARELQAHPGAPIVLVVDQCEELFSLSPADDRDAFCAALVDALSAADGRLLVVAALRADYLGGPLVVPGVGELIRTGTEIVTPMTSDELERSIVRPAESVGVQLEAGLATQILSDVARQPGALPVLQFALTELMERAEGARMTRSAYEAIGGVSGALDRQAESTLAGLDAPRVEIARQVFLRLVVPGEAGAPVARRVARGELEALSDGPRIVDEVIDAFGRSRLLSFDLDAMTGEPTVELAHEALLSRWPRLVRWLEEARQDLWTRRRIEDAALDWATAGRDPGFLLSGTRLDVLASWATTTRLRLDDSERELLEASLAERRRLDGVQQARVAHERALQRRATGRLRGLVAVLAAAVLLVTSLTVVVYGQGEAAREQGDIAAARELAAASIGRVGVDPTLSLLLARRAADATVGRGYVVEEALDALNWALQAAHAPYPPGEAPAAVRDGPDGRRGIELLPPGRLMELASAAAIRSLSPAECRTYLHRSPCPASPAPATGEIRVYTAAGTVPIERLASTSLAGTRVEAMSELPSGVHVLDASFAPATGIDVAWAPAEDGLAARVESGDLPDIAIVRRPAQVAELARRGLLVDLSTFVDVAAIKAADGQYVAGLGTVAADGAWPATEGRVYAVPVTLEARSTVWYPRAEFERAGYGVPGSLDALYALSGRMVADGLHPWCIGLASSVAPGDAVDFVEELVLRSVGRAEYDRWTNGLTAFVDSPVRNAFQAFRALVSSTGTTLGGVGGALQTPERLAAWPMLVVPPACWLHLGGGTERSSLPAGRSGVVATFPFPGKDSASSAVLRGRAFMLVVFHDRPEVRRAVGAIVSVPPAAVLDSLARAGMWSAVPGAAEGPGLDDTRTLESERLHAALGDGTFRVAASDLMPTPVSIAFTQGMLTYLTWGDARLEDVLVGIDQGRNAATSGGASVGSGG